MIGSPPPQDQTPHSTLKKPSSSPQTTTPKSSLPQILPPKIHTPLNDPFNGTYEFGGTLGCIGFILFSHFILYYFYICVTKYNGSLVLPDVEFVDYLIDECTPNMQIFRFYMGFLMFEYTCAIFLPGPVLQGLPIPSLNNSHLSYKCNALPSWMLLLSLVTVLQITGLGSFDIGYLSLNFGRFMTSSIMVSNLTSMLLYAYGVAFNKCTRMSNNVVYDFFMGAMLNPRLPFNIDLKMMVEMRVSWHMLFLLTVSSAVRQYQVDGSVGASMVFIVVAQGLYANACQKGEECAVSTWDVFYEKLGWMLTFWNISGIPFLYSIQALYLLHHTPSPPFTYFQVAVMYATLFGLYYVWDTANSQKNKFRMQRQGVALSVVKRKTYPYFSYGYIENPYTIISASGDKELFVDGWFMYSRTRKIHYSTDVGMSLLWGLCCGGDCFIPYFYSCFFIAHLVHRTQRDEEKCRLKYGDEWDEYCKVVNWKFIPGFY